ncbi:DJ-1 family glyoxalase III [Brachyspira hampsonii]|uniref:DJ-1 family protein n=1 Tax=Brachyspira hampsonii 30446 TaxID=1289135 RepID=A0A2U4F7C3_9SPIR|nr:DJ-1 family glyoxalase III [Brachyspira hampsonii]EKV57110.1 DJ-1 family protein [Brachyspira hampsonii 30446]MBW5389236.1 DJ-1/PfpI family protein [Brachyspira hampsonii]MBW5394187.1 DJ-1/PfpI family protein [Brachyspira hampsonii]OEJ16913.1 4-methyl-5(B-hydroxyethyl)-thiazole monophosphate biosynthesis protein [Brachyspira hampsonii]PTY39642.1 4-methyl-5(B-hydroxyethyl)-thiazole monophosphate biosynthesis protein [Brachyspira hampsonii bv. II]
MSKKVLVPLAEGAEEIEAITIIDVLRRANIEVVTASLTDNLEVKGSHNIIIKADTSFEKIVNSDFDGIALAGGYGGMNNLKADKRVLEKIKSMYEAKKLVSAICASPIVLGEAGVIKGKYTCYPGLENDVKGGEYIEKDIVVCNDNVITSKGPATTVFFALELVKYLTGSNEELANALLVNLIK